MPTFKFPHVLAVFLLSVASDANIFSGYAAPIEPVLSGGEFRTLDGSPEVFGKEMSVAFSGLAEGVYTVEVDAAENYVGEIGKRVMSVRSGDKVLGAEVDLFKIAGKGKTVLLQGALEHKSDSLRGPLTVSFFGVVGNAKFDAIRLKDVTGKVVAQATAAALEAESDRRDETLRRIPAVAGPEIWKDAGKSPAARAVDLVRRLSVREKISQIMMAAPGIPRLGIPAYDWWNECLHGVARAGVATVFPQAIAGAATWDPELWQAAASAMGDEARAKNNEAARRNSGATERYFGLDMWSPNVNIFRDPRWGRGQETYGEDPFLTGRFGVAFVAGLQGDDPDYIKVIASPKHFAVHSGPEASRHVFDAQVSDQDLRETYLPAFEACIREGKAYSLMGAYNCLRGESCSSSKLLLIDILRDQWGFQGYTVSDVDSVRDIYATHHLEPTASAAAARALKNGLDVNSGNTYRFLGEALRNGECAVADIDKAVLRCMEARIRLGLFDPTERVRYARIPFSNNDSPAHDALNYKVAQEAMVLLKNTGKTLPMAKTGTIAVIGPNADDAGTAESDLMVGNYNGTPSTLTTVLAGIKKKLDGKARVLYAKGCEISSGSQLQWEEALAAARQADKVIMVMGINPHVEGEEGDGGDRSGLDLYPAQEKLLKSVMKLRKPVVLVLLNGSALAVNWADEHVPAILEAWYPGPRGGEAVADVLFGDYNPAGRLPVTFYKTEKDLPPFDDYNMKGRTYRYFNGKPLYAFGHGLSYTTFGYSSLKLKAGADGTQMVSVQIKNTGDRAGDEVVELYVSRNDAPADAGLPIRALRGLKRVNLQRGETKTVSFCLTPFQLAFVNKQGVREVAPGRYTIGVGGSQRSAQSITIKIAKTITDPAYMSPPVARVTE